MSELSIDWGNFLISAAAGVNGEPESVRERCKDWLLESADRIGLPREKLAFPDVAPFQRQVGTLLDPNGCLVYIFVDGEVLNLKTVTDAVRVACVLHPTTLYPVSIPRPPAPPEPVPEPENNTVGHAATATNSAGLVGRARSNLGRVKRLVRGVLVKLGLWD